MAMFLLAFLFLAVVVDATSRCFTINTAFTSSLSAQGGQYLKMDLTSTKNPFVVYRSSVSGNQLHMLQCLDAQCANSNHSLLMFQSAELVGIRQAMHISPLTGKPVTVFASQSSPALRLTDCDPILPLCADQVIDLGAPTQALGGIDMQLDPANNFFPVFSHPDTEPGPAGPSLRVVRCFDPSCATKISSKVTTLGPFASVNLGIDAAGVPAVSYATSGSLVLVKCADVNCTLSASVQFLGANSIGTHSMQLSTQGLPRIAFQSDMSQLVLMSCGSKNCSARASVPLVQTGDPRYPSMALLADIPIIAYHDAADTTLRVMECHAPACGSSSTVFSVDGSGTGTDAGLFISLGLAGDVIVVAYQFHDMLGYKSIRIATGESCNSAAPSSVPTNQPSNSPSAAPTMMLSATPSRSPTGTRPAPSTTPSKSPSTAPTRTPLMRAPTAASTTQSPTGSPTRSPTVVTPSPTAVCQYDYIAGVGCSGASLIISADVTFPSVQNLTVVLQQNSSITVEGQCAQLADTVVILQLADISDVAAASYTPIRYPCRVGDADFRVESSVGSCAQITATPVYGATTVSVGLSLDSSACGPPLPLILGVTFGAVLLLAIAALLLIPFMRKRRLKKYDQEMNTELKNRSRTLQQAKEHHAKAAPERPPRQ